MSESVALALPLAEALREMVRQWIARGKSLDAPRRTSAQRSDSAPIVQLVRVTSGTADSDGYPCLVREWDGSAWSEPYAAARLIHSVSGGTFAANNLAMARLVRVTPAGMLVYASEATTGSEAGIDLSGRTGSITGVTNLQILNAVASGTPTAAIITPDVASATLAGIVSTGTQTIVGQKTFSDITTIGDDLMVNGIIAQQLTDFLLTIDDGFSSRESLNAYMSEGVNDTVTPVYTVTVRPAASGSSASSLLINKDAVDAGQTCLIGNSGFVATEISAINGHGFSIVVPGGGTYPYASRLAGASGTSGGGDTVNGGIITVLGSGTTGVDGGTF